MSDIITNTTSTNESKVFNVYVSKSTTAGTALVTRGSLNKTDPTPTVVGLYILEETGIYPNLGNIDAEAGKLNFASFDGTTWSLISVDVNANEISKEYQSDNLFDYTTVLKDVYVDADGGISPANGWFVSDKIPVEPNQIFQNQTSLAGAFYDANNNFIPPRIGAATTEITAPQNAVYFRATGGIADVEKRVLALGKFNHYALLENQTGAKTISKKLLPPSVLSRKGNNLIISVRGGGDFRWINDALDWLRNSGENDVFNPFTFEIIDGEYVESVNMI